MQVRSLLISSLAGLVLFAGQAQANPGAQDTGRLALDEVLTPTLAGMQRKDLKLLSPTQFLVSQRRDPEHTKVYLDCGLVAAATANYGAESILVMELDSPLGALCALGNDKTLDGTPVDSFRGPQSEAFRERGAVFLRQERYVVRVKGSQQNSGGGAKAAALLKAIAFVLPNPKAPDSTIESLRQLPGSGRIPGSERYLSRSVFGWSKLEKGFSADYGCGDVGLSIANVLLDVSDNARTVQRAAVGEAHERGFQLENLGYGDESVLATKEGSNPAYFIRVGDLLAVVDADAPVPAACQFLTDELVSQMRGRQAQSRD